MSDHGHLSVHGDDTPEGAVVESDLQAVSPEAVEREDYTRRSPGSGLTEADVTARRADTMTGDATDDDRPALGENQVAVHPDEQPHPEGGKELEAVAREVLDGKWGRGQERRMRLADAGYDAAEVDAAVVKLLNPDPTEVAEAEQERVEQARRDAEQAERDQQDDQSLEGQ